MSKRKQKADFFKHDHIMTTAELDSYRVYYADIQQLLNEGFIEKIKQCGKTAE